MSREAWDIILVAGFLTFAFSAKIEGYMILTVLCSIFLIRNADKTNF